jgi:antitoxin component YwqK of YwqJK toxin-antitoxin module
MGRLILILILVFISFGSFSQSFKIYKGDTVNVRDVNNKRQGVWVKFNKAGNVIEKGKYINNKKEGIWMGYYPSGKIKHEITYKKNRPDGPAKFYYENGKISEQGIWKMNKWVGNYKYFHKNGNLAYDWKYNDSGRRTGEQKYYYEDGSLMIKGDWTDGKKIGVLTEFYPDGSIKSEINFVEGKIQVSSVKEYEVAEKPAKKQIAPKLQTVNKKTFNKPQVFNKTGYYKTYNEFKKLDREGQFVNGKLMDGKRCFYDEDGNLIRTLIYKNGKITEVIDNTKTQ